VGGLSLAEEDKEKPQDWLKANHIDDKAARRTTFKKTRRQRHCNLLILKGGNCRFDVPK
jgi:hypothetical protein